MKRPTFRPQAHCGAVASAQRGDSRPDSRVESTYSSMVALCWPAPNVTVGMPWRHPVGVEAAVGDTEIRLSPARLAADSASLTTERQASGWNG